MNKRNEIESELKDTLLASMKGEVTRHKNGSYQFHLRSTNNSLDPDNINLIPIFLEILKDLYQVQELLPDLEYSSSSGGDEGELAALKERLTRLESVDILQTSIHDYHNWSEEVEKQRNKQKDDLHKKIIDRYDERIKALELKLNTLENAQKPKTTITLNKARSRSNSLAAAPTNTKFKNVVSKLDTGRTKK